MKVKRITNDDNDKLKAIAGATGCTMEEAMHRAITTFYYSTCLSKRFVTKEESKPIPTTGEYYE